MVGMTEVDVRGGPVGGLPGVVECGQSLARQLVGHDPHEVLVGDGVVWCCDGRGVVVASPLCGRGDVHEGHAFDTKDGQWCAGWSAGAVEADEWRRANASLGTPPAVAVVAEAVEGTEGDGPLLTAVRADLAALDCTGGARGSLASLAIWLAARMDRMGGDGGATTVARLAQELRATMVAIAAPRQGGEGAAVQELVVLLSTPERGRS